MAIMEQIKIELDMKADLPIDITIINANAITVRNEDGDPTKFIDIIRNGPIVMLATIDIGGENEYTMYDITAMEYNDFIANILYHVKNLFSVKVFH